LTRPGPLPEHRPSGFFVLRTPLLPAAAHARVGDGIRSAVAAAAATGPADFPAALAHDRGLARERLASALDDSVLRAAIAVASPTTEAGIAAWRRDPESRRGRKTERALLRYLTRAANRPTPFGLFAGVSVGRVGASTALALPAREDYVSRTRISHAWTTELASALAGRPELRARLLLRVNPTLYRLPGRRRYVARRREDDNWVHVLRQVRERPALAAVLERAGDGASREELADVLVAAGTAEPERARAYVDQLIEQELLIADLAPPVTGGESVDALLARLEAAGAGDTPVAGALRDARQAVAALEADGLRAGPERYGAARAQLRELHPAPMGSQPLSVELHKPAAELSLGPEVVAELAAAVEVVRHWAPAQPDPLAAFRRAFQRRYGRREVLLTEAIDDDAGVGLAVLQEPRPAVAVDEARDRLLLAKVAGAQRRGSDEIVVGLDELDAGPPPLPPSFAVGARLSAASAQAVDGGDFELWLKSARGPDAMGMFARFCHGSEPLERAVRAHLREEQALDPGALHAEIATLAQLKLAGVLHRPVLREAEIDYLGPSGAPPERRLALEDLLISVAGDEVRLRSRRDGRWVVPRLAAAINIDLLLPPAFRLLLFIERQHGVSLSWDWGSLRAAPHHPRVRVGRTILSAAHWRLDRDDIAPLAAGTDEERFRATAALRTRLGLPRMVAVTDADNVLPVDLDTTVGVDLLIGLLRGRAEAHLFEVHPDPSRLCVTGPEGTFASELVVPFLARAPVQRPPPPGPPAPAPVRRTFAPGSEWLYLKLYSGAAAADGLIRDRVGPLCARLAAEGVLTDWFFIRYADPELHLRVRLHGDPAALRDAAMPLVAELSEGLLERRMIWRASLETYEREVERYGGAAGIEPCEAWFHADSEAAVAALATGGEGAEGRWRTALVATDAALDAFGLDPLQRRDAMRVARAHIAATLDVETPGAHDPRSFAERYGRRHREERDVLQHLLAEARGGGEAAAFEPYRERVARFEAIAAALRRGALSVPPVELALSLVHMRINRLLRLGSLEPELRLYDALERLYSSELVRAGAAHGG
jgi:lantibiotic biosynthesis protein